MRAASGIEHPARDFRRIIHRAGIRHGADGGKSSRSRGHGAAGDGLFVRLAGLSQMDMNIDEAGRDDESAGVESVVGFSAQFAGGRDFNHATIFEQEIVLALKTLSGVDEETVADCESSGLHEEPFAADISAISNWQLAISQTGHSRCSTTPASCQLLFARSWFTLPPDTSPGWPF